MFQTFVVDDVLQAYRDDGGKPLHEIRGEPRDEASPDVTREVERAYEPFLAHQRENRDAARIAVRIREKRRMA